MSKAPKENKIDEKFRCGTKVKYASRLEATKQAYILSENRRQEYEIYVCPYCHWVHVGRVNRKRRPN